MADIATTWDAGLAIGDWVLTPAQDGLIVDERGASIVDDAGGALQDGLFTGAGIVIGNDLGTAILISLFTDATAGDDDIIPDGSGDPRGWWGDLGADRPIGSKLWLRLRSKQTATTLALVKDDIETALAWLVDDGVAARVEVDVSWVRPGMLGAEIAVFRGDGRRLATSFTWAWKEL